MCNWWSKLLDKIGMLLVFSPNWFFGLFCQAGHRTQVPSSFSDAPRSQIYGHLQAGCGFCKQNLLRRQPSASCTHQQACWSEHCIHTHASARKAADCMQRRQQERRRNLLYLLPVLLRYLSCPGSCCCNLTKHNDFATLAHSFSSSAGTSAVCAWSLVISHSKSQPHSNWQFDQKRQRNWKGLSPGGWAVTTQQLN